MTQLAIGGVEPLGLITLFQTCNRAYDVFIRSAKNLGKDAHLLGVHLEIERKKLTLWGSYLGISKSQQCRLLRAESFDTQCLVVKLLDTISMILDDIDVIMVRYGVKVVEASSDLETQVTSIGLKDLDLENIRTCEAVKMTKLKREATERSIIASTSRLGKIRWALNDSKKLDALVQDLRIINENLWVSLPVNKWLALAKGLPSVVLPEIYDQEILREVRGAARGSETTKLLAACSELRIAAIASAAKESSPSFGDELKLQPDCLLDSISLTTGDSKLSAEAQRQFSLIKDKTGAQKQVIIEWRYVEARLEYHEIEAVHARIKSLAVLLSTQRTSEFGLLRCVGFFKERKPHIERYGLLFEIQNGRLVLPTSETPLSGLGRWRPRSLYEYISTTNPPPALGDRFRIASALCHTLLQLHASSWLHKAIRASNVIFFPYDSLDDAIENVRVDIAHPFLMGFDYSRPDKPTAESLDVPDNRTFNDYRHPELWATPGSPSTTRYRKAFDVYALGVVLLEVGHWKLVSKSIGNQYRNSRNPELWKEQLVQSTKSLGYKCGAVYQEAVVTCLTGVFKESAATPINDEFDDALQHSFLFDVVYRLGNCFA